MHYALLKIRASVLPVCPTNWLILREDYPLLEQVDSYRRVVPAISIYASQANYVQTVLEYIFK